MPDSQFAQSIHFRYAVYLLPTRSSRNLDPLPTLREAVRRIPDLSLVGELPAQPIGMVVRAYVENDVEKEYAPPSMESLRYHEHGLSPDQERALQQCKRALILDFAHPRKHVWAGLRNANVLMDDLAPKIGGLAWDEETREMFSSEAWHKQRVESWAGEVRVVSNETVIHIYENGGSVRAITLGMSKMGLPDVTMNSSGWSSENQIAGLINIFSQRLAEGAQIRTAGLFRLDLLTVRSSEVRQDELKSIKGKGLGVACLSLSPGRWEEGDPKNRLIQLSFDEYPGADIGAKQESMISSFFGSDDSISKMQHNDELLAASGRAKAKLPELQKAFSTGLPGGEFIQV